MRYFGRVWIEGQGCEHDSKVTRGREQDTDAKNGEDIERIIWLVKRQLLAHVELLVSLIKHHARHQPSQACNALAQSSLRCHEIRVHAAHARRKASYRRKNIARVHVSRKRAQSASPPGCVISCDRIRDEWHCVQLTLDECFDLNTMYHLQCHLESSRNQILYADAIPNRLISCHNIQARFI